MLLKSLQLNSVPVSIYWQKITKLENNKHGFPNLKYLDLNDFLCHNDLQAESIFYFDEPSVLG